MDDDNNVSIGVGKRIKRGNKEYRVIYATEEHVVLCEMNTENLNCILESTDKLLDLLSQNINSIIEEPEYVVRPELLPPKKRDRFIKRKEAIGKLVDALGPYYFDISKRQHSALFDEIAKDLNVKRRSVRRLLIKYLQSGMSDYSLLPYKRLPSEHKHRYSSNKLGRPSEDGDGVLQSLEVHKQFDDAIRYYKEKKECSSWEDALQYLKKNSLDSRFCQLLR